MQERYCSPFADADGRCAMAACFPMVFRLPLRPLVLAQPMRADSRAVADCGRCCGPDYPIDHRCPDPIHLYRAGR